jgi:DNA-binding transcriptional LysR family regulator
MIYDRQSQMSWRHTPIDLKVFVRVAELQSFSAAARDLRLTPSGVSKAVTRIESRLGVRLLHRTTRSVVLTGEGEGYFEHCRRILREMERAEAELSRHRDAPHGLLRVNCALTFGQHQFVPTVPEFLARYPGVQVELALTDHIVSLMDEGVDLVIRIGTPPESSLVRRKICDFKRVICASPEYLKRHGEPRAPEDLRAHNCLYVTTLNAHRTWPFDTATGPLEMEVTGNCSANNANTVLDLALRGLGIACLADYLTGEQILQGRLVPLLVTSYRAEPVPLYALYPPGRQRSPKIAAMLNFLVEKFSPAPWRTGTYAGTLPISDKSNLRSASAPSGSHARRGGR